MMSITDLSYFEYTGSTAKLVPTQFTQRNQLVKHNQTITYKSPSQFWDDKNKITFQNWDVKIIRQNKALAVK